MIRASIRRDGLDNFSSCLKEQQFEPNCAEKFFDRKFNDGNPISRRDSTKIRRVARRSRRGTSREGTCILHALKCRHILLLLRETLAFQFTIVSQQERTRRTRLPPRSTVFEFPHSFGVLREPLSLTSRLIIREILFSFHSFSTSCNQSKFFSLRHKLSTDGQILEILETHEVQEKETSLFYPIIRYRASVYSNHQERRMRSNAQRFRLKSWKLSISRFSRGKRRGTTYK